ncbi:molybdate ABC transporter substrate-binding protein [Cellulomonas fimi]|uniref:Molybdate ABC transporter substrate-binding protein n=1 Tax=Cellulomonas fimi TaxID=1708 RepID=A0A7Y0QGZ7_CELFI|nr:molybdate ABC transporter substrate-binding protein [Cellulomonas fimi]NMR18647.1 molybdate ABC transporter substrate-binding protein [Cellulomonas fimi]
MRSRARSPARPFVFAVLAALALVACAAGPRSPAASGTGAAEPGEVTGQVAGELTVLAAASLRPAFDELAALLEREHPDLDVRPITYDGSSTLATQLVQGAPGDVFTAADQRTMATVADAGLLAGAPTVVARNTLRLVVLPDNPHTVRTPADLTRADLQVVLCAAEVPCGAAARAWLDAAGVDLTPASEEQNVTAVVTKVAAGEADAGLVWASDVRSADGRVEAVEVPDAVTAASASAYPVAVLADAANPSAARAFIALAGSPTGQALLARYGFTAP